MDDTICTCRRRRPSASVICLACDAPPASAGVKLAQCWLLRPITRLQSGAVVARAIGDPHSTLQRLERCSPMARPLPGWRDAGPRMDACLTADRDLPIALPECLETGPA
ncbi:hypothetical protein T31B1_02920 [Salinisphaera sp. T31B1]